MGDAGADAAAASGAAGAAFEHFAACEGAPAFGVAAPSPPPPTAAAVATFSCNALDPPPYPYPAAAHAPDDVVDTVLMLSADDGRGRAGGADGKSSESDASMERTSSRRRRRVLGVRAAIDKVRAETGCSVGAVRRRQLVGTLK